MSERRRFNQIPARTAQYNAEMVKRRQAAPLARVALKWTPPTEREQALMEMEPQDEQLQENN